jgi:hypothetical protein
VILLGRGDPRTQRKNARRALIVRRHRVWMVEEIARTGGYPEAQESDEDADR